MPPQMRYSVLTVVLACAVLFRITPAAAGSWMERLHGTRTRTHAAPGHSGVAWVWSAWHPTIQTPAVPATPPMGRGLGHMIEALQLSQCPLTACSDIEVLSLRQAPCRADQMRQAGLLCLHPTLIHLIAIADQQSRPIVNQRGKRFFGAARVDHTEGYLLTGHHPESLEDPVTVPGGFIDVVDRGLPRLLSNHHIVRLNSLRHAVEDLLDGP
jgi:hypothetical protein